VTVPSEEPLRVAMVCPYDLARPGGVQGQARGLAEALRRLGHRVLVIAPEASVGVRANGSVAPVSLSPLQAARAVRSVERWRADVVHLHEPMAPVLGYGFLVSHRWPTVATFHRSGEGAGYRAVAPLARWAYQRLDVRCAVSEAAARTAAAAGGGIDEVLFNGVDLSRFRWPRPESEGPPAVLFLGRHEHRKGLGVLLEAFSSLEGPAVLWISGAGPETERLRLAYPPSGRISWLGTLRDEEVADRLARATVLCAPSLGGESFGMVLLEAMAAGCPVVASDIPGYREAAGGSATLVAPGDPQALAAALSRQLAGAADPDARSRARGRAGERSMDRLAARYVDVYRRAVASRERSVLRVS
jgi:phosphatidyl-myo-inositol alpha-mannosyltransferase